MVNSSWIINWQLALLALTIIPVKGFDNLYSNSFISPNSASHEDVENSFELADRTSAPKEIGVTTTSASINIRPSKIEKNNRVQRSADPIISRTKDIDNLLVYKNVEESLDSNDVEFTARRAELLQPSRTEIGISSNGYQQITESLAGEEKRAPQGRSLQEPKRVMPTAMLATQNFASLSYQQGKGRQAEPDIQDIITGIVKLLNGNVNVQANTAPAMGRPLRPLSTRINNRGPPRITDVPALPPDFDVPAPPLPPPPLGPMPPPPNRIHTPYPFDLPPHNTSPLRPFSGVNLPEQLVPNKRPGLYRPITIPPWNNRPPQRRPGNRRPTPIPSYKPLPPDYISFTSKKPTEDIFNLDLGTHLQPHEEEIKSTTYTSSETVDTTTSIILETSENVDEEIIEFEKNKEKSSSKKDKYTSKTTSVTPTPPSLDNSEMSSESSSKIDMLTSETVTSSTTSSILIEPTASISSESTPTHIKTPIVDTVPLNDTMFLLNSTEIATPVLESSMQEVLHTLKEELVESTSIISTPTKELFETFHFNENFTTISSSTAVNSTPNITSQEFPYYPYRPRPGIVLDDTEYKPGGGKYRPNVITRPPIGQIGDIFDVTVSAIQGPGGSSHGHGKPYVIPVDLENLNGNQDVITSAIGNDAVVSIDGKRTYLNLFGDIEPSTTAAPIIKPSVMPNQVSGTGYAVAETETKSPIKPTPRRPLYGRPKPSQPPVRIDTCIVGDDSTCDASQNEFCRTEAGVSACHCRPGHARRKHRDICRKIVAVLLSLRVDKLYERRVVWATELDDQNSESYQQLSFETERALESAMSMTPFSDEFLGAKVNSIYSGVRSAGQAGVFVNLTLQLEENADTARPTVRAEIQKHLLGVIQRRSNNVGNSALWVDSIPGSVSNLQDLDECSSPELHDCHSLARCINIFGSFKCECEEGYRDQWADSKHRAGRNCEQCSNQNCNNRGECKYKNGQEVCICSGNYYGNQCELDGEVLGVAIGASVAAVIIIGLTLVCLVMWSRRWNREQKAAVGSPVFGYMATASNSVKAPVVGNPPYQLTLEDRLRWAQLADVMAQANHYAPEPVSGPTRPSSAMFGYPNLAMNGTVQRSSMHGTLPPIPLPRLNLQTHIGGRTASCHGMRPLDNSSSSEEEDKTDLLGRSFQVPRPKSRSNASIANQSGIYYDVDYDQHDIYKQGGGIPLSTYSMARPGYFRN